MVSHNQYWDENFHMTTWNIVASELQKEIVCSIFVKENKYRLVE